MRNLSKTHVWTWVVAASCRGSGAAVAGCRLAAGGSEWTSAGGNRQNTRFQESEHTLSVATWAGSSVEVAGHDSGRRLGHSGRRREHGLRARLGRQPLRGRPADRRVKWTSEHPGATGVLPRQGACHPGGDRRQGDRRHAGRHPLRRRAGCARCSPSTSSPGRCSGRPGWTASAAIITQSATVFDGRVYVGVASQEEALAAFVPGYELSFRGSMLALDLEPARSSGRRAGPGGYTGNAVWGSSPAIDTKRGQVDIATGNNYSAPGTTLACVAAAPPGPARAACLPADDYFDSDPGARHEDRRGPLGDAGDRRTTPGRSTASRSSATATSVPTRPARLRLRPGAGAVQDEGRQGEDDRVGRSRAEERPVLGARSRHRRRRDGSRRPVPAAPPAASSGARPSTTPASTPPTPTATSSVDAARRRGRRRRASWTGINAATGQLLWQ